MIKKEVKTLKNGTTIIITKKRKLKARYKTLIILCYLFISFIGIKNYFNNIDEMLTSCDQQKSYTCSYYEAELLAKKEGK